MKPKRMMKYGARLNRAFRMGSLLGSPMLLSVVTAASGQVIDLSEAADRERILLVEQVSLGSLREVVRARIKGLKLTEKGDFQVTTEVQGERVEIILGFEKGRLRSLRYLTEGPAAGRAYRSAKLYLIQTYGNPDSKGESEFGRVFSWCVEGMAIEVRPLGGQENFRGEWEFSQGCREAG